MTAASEKFYCCFMFFFVFFFHLWRNGFITLPRLSDVSLCLICSFHISMISCLWIKIPLIFLNVVKQVIFFL